MILAGPPGWSHNGRALLCNDVPLTVPPEPDRRISKTVCRRVVHCHPQHVPDHQSESSVHTYPEVLVDDRFECRVNQSGWREHIAQQIDQPEFWRAKPQEDGDLVEALCIAVGALGLTNFSSQRRRRLCGSCDMVRISPTAVDHGPIHW